MYLKVGRVTYIVVSVITLVTGLYNTLVLSEYIHLFYSVIAAVFLVYSRGLLRLLTGFSWCLLASGLTPVSTLFCIVLPFLLVYTYDEPRRSSDTYLSLKLLALAFVFVPIYVLRTQALIPFTSYVASVLIMVFLSYVYLSRSRVILSKTSFSTYLGDYIEVPLSVESVHKVSYKVFLNEDLVMEGLLRGSKDLVIKLLPNIAGVKIYSIKVVLSDLRGFSRITYGPYLVRVKIVPKSLTIVRSVREILSRYVESVRPPIIYVGWVEAFIPTHVTPTESGVGSEATSGYVGVGAAGVSRGSEGSVPSEESVGSGQGLDSGLSSLYGGVIKYRFKWVIPTKLIESLRLQTSKTFLGDYAGVREYYPGDHPKSIHWKKSVSTGELAVKVYTRSSESGGGRFSLLIADWDASNPVELDNLIQATYSALLMEKYVKILYLKLPGGKVYLIKGGVIEVLKALDFIMLSEDIESRFNYESWVRRKVQNLVDEFRIANEPLRSVDRYYRTLSDSLIEELEKQGLPRNSSFMIIHPRAYTIRYLYLTHKLRENGYRATQLTKILQPSEVSKRLREIIKTAI